MILSLNGKWEFYDSDENLDVEDLHFDNKIKIPSCIEEFFEDHKERMFFKKEFAIDLDSEKRYFLNFEAVDYHADVYMNKKFLGSHDGGYTPFFFEITEVLKENNELVVHVTDPTEEKATEIPHGKQNGIPNWYGNVSGIWRDVYIEERGKDFFESLYVDASYLKHSLQIHGNLDKKVNSKIRIVLKDEDKVLIDKSELINSKDFVFEFSIDKIIPWSFDNPKLYLLQLELIQEGAIMDRWESKIGFRDIESVNGKILLNGKEFFVRGVLDQDFYPVTLYTTPSISCLKDEFVKAKMMGLNLLRCHIKVPDRRYLELADEMGMLIWEEIPNFDKFTDKSTKEFGDTLDEIIERDYNHPSFVIFTVINESWGLDLSKGEQRKWLHEMYRRAKKIVGNRLVVDNSPCSGNFHIETDIDDFHFYRSLDHVQEWNSDISRFVCGEKDTFSNYGDSEKNEKEPKIISEFGIWGLPAFIRDVKRMGRPFRSIPETIPDGVEERFFNSSLSKHFKDYETFAILTQKEQFNALKYQIEEIRLYSSIKGYVITEFTDVFWEANGLLDMHRRPKWHFDLLKMINTPILLIPRASKYSYFIGEPLNVDLTISNYSRTTGEMRLHVRIENVELLSKDIDVTDGMNQHKLTLKIEKIRGLKKIWFELEDRNGVIVSKNYMDIAVLEIPEFKDEAGNVEIVYLEKEGEYTFGNSKISVLKKKNMLSGDWITNFNWMAPDIFKDVSDGGVMDIRHISLLKNGLMMKVIGDADVVAGVTYGWIYGELAYVVVVRNKRHLTVATTFSMPKEEPINLVMQEVFNKLKVEEFS